MPQPGLPQLRWPRPGLRWFAPGILGLTLVACASDGAPVSGPDNVVLEKTVSATGTLVTLEDRVPVDGGVVLVVATAGGETAEFTIPSFFTAEPVPPKRWELYRRVVEEFSEGDRVMAKGEREGDRVVLTRIEHR